MADETQSRGSEEPSHRGRIQAQGGDTAKSESWAQATAPTVSEMLRKCDALEEQLTAREKKDREQPMADLRAYIRRAARAGGLSANPQPHKKSFPKRGSKDIRVDLEIQKGTACVPDPGDG